jgi:TolA-binding protein
MVAECLFAQQKFAEALAAYQKVKDSPTEVSAKDFQVLTLLHGGQAAGQLKQWDKSLQLLRECARKFPYSPYIPEALYEQGWAQQNLNKLDEAITLYKDVIARTSREVAARAQFMIGEIQFQQKKHGEAVISFYKVSAGYGYPRWQADATYEAARCFEVLDKPAQAKKLYQELIEKFPQSDKAPLAQDRVKELQ